MTENGVAPDLLVPSDRLSTLAVVHFKNGSATYSFYDENLAGRMMQPTDMPVLSNAESALYSEGIGLVAVPAADIYADLLAREASDYVVMIDPNIRLGFISNGAAYGARLDQMISHSNIVKVSDEDLNWIVGDEGELNTKALRMLAKGLRFVIVILGADGAGVFDANGPAKVPAVRATVVDTVGAGVTFNAGALAHLSNSGQLSRASL